MLTYSILAKGVVPEKKIASVQKILDQTCQCQTIAISEYPGQMLSLVKQMVTSDLLVVIGGDGTFHEVITGSNSCELPPILFLPGGTVNDMSHNLNYHGPMEQYINKCLQTSISTHDIFNINSQPFCYIAGGGYLMNCIYECSSDLKKLLKRNAYILKIINGLREEPKLTHVKIEIDGKTIILEDVITFIFSNTKTLGNMSIYNECSLNDNLCELLVIQNTSRWNIIQELLYANFKKKDLEKLSFASIYQGHEFHIEMNQTFPFCFDGEKGFESNIVDVNCRRKIKVLRPE